MSETNETELRERLEECRQKILKIEARNGEISALLKDAESGISYVQAEAQKWDYAKSECFDCVRSGLSKLNPRSSFRETYLQRIRSVLDGYESSCITETYHDLQRDIYACADELEDELASNQTRLQELREEMHDYTKLLETTQREMATWENQ